MGDIRKQRQLNEKIRYGVVQDLGFLQDEMVFENLISALPLTERDGEFFWIWLKQA